MLLLVYLSLFVSVSSSTYTISQEFFTQYFTDNDFTAWNPYGSNLPLMKMSNCSNNRIFGGYNNFIGNPTTPNGITRTWTGLIPHFSIRITAKIYKIDSWVNNNLFIMVDGVSVKIYTFNSANGGTTDICGNPTPIPDTINTNFNQVINNLDITVPHTSSAITINIISNLLSNTGSWGMRQFKLTMQACDQSCLTCNNASSCSTCDTANGLALIGAFCSCSIVGTVKQKKIPCIVTPCVTCIILPCSNGYYLSGTTGLCQPCNIACSVCTNPVNSLVTCSTCAVGFNGNPPITLCNSCFSGCASCTGLASNNCNACQYGYFFYSPTGSCLQSCPTGWYSQQKTSKCFLCSSPCASCIGNNGGSYFCLSCVAGRYYFNYTCQLTCPNSLYGYNGSCITTCPQTTYSDTITFACLNCVANCLECSNGTVCFICQTNYFMRGGLCLASCPVGQYGSITTFLCITCHTDCQTCNGPFINNCLSCAGGAVMLNGVCYTTCPTYTYSALCLLCDSTCLTCSGSGSNACLTCPSPQFFHNNFSSCLNTCNKGDISDNYNMTCTQCLSGQVAYFQKCTPCNPTCKTCNGIIFLQCSSCSSEALLIKNTCVTLGDSRIIYSPHLSQTQSVNVFLLIILVSHLCFSFLLQLFFEYKTNLLLTIQLIQILSYTYYLSIQLCYSTQLAAIFLYYSNFANLLSLVSIAPNPSLPTKFQLLGKTGYFLADAFGVNVIMLSIIILFLSIKYLSNRSSLLLKFYNKINPYILTYSFRLIFLELSLDIILYLYCFDSSSGAGVISLILLLIDIAVIVGGCCWKIKTKEDGSQIALFYFNQIGQSTNDVENVYLNDQNQQGIQQKIKNSKIFPSVIILIAKAPIPITILLFIGNSSTQTICYIIYFFFYLLLNIVLPYRRKIYKYTTYFCCVILIINAFIILLIDKAGTSSVALESVWATAIIIVFVLSLMQLVTNYQYFIQFCSYIGHKLGSNQTKQERNQQSHSNLTDTNIEDPSIIKKNSKIRVQNLQPSVIFDNNFRYEQSNNGQFSHGTSYLQLHTNTKNNTQQNIKLDLDL